MQSQIRIFLSLIVVIAFSGCASFKPPLDAEGNTGLGTDPFSLGGQYTYGDANAMNNSINENSQRIDTIIGDAWVAQADCSTITSGWCRDTDDNVLYYWDGDSVESMGSSGGGGTVDLNGTITADEIAVFYDLDTLKSIPMSTLITTHNIQTAPAEGPFVDDDKTKLDALDLDRVEAGDTSVRTADTGVGSSSVYVDGVLQEITYSGYKAHPDGFSTRLVTTTADDCFEFQAYDANDTNYECIIKVCNGDSSSSGVGSYPRLELCAGAGFVGLSNLSSSMRWSNGAVPLTTNTTLTSAGMNQLHKINGAIAVTLPQVSTIQVNASEAPWVQFMTFSANVLTVNPDDADAINRDGTSQSVGVDIDTDGSAMAIVTCIGTDDIENGSSTDGWVCISNKALSQGT